MGSSSPLSFTTRIYCRPVCPAKHSLTKNVSYYPTAAAAERAGYRPCLRCRPETAPFCAAWNGTRTTVERALRLIDEGALDAGNVNDLADRLGVGARHLSRLFAKHVGASPLQTAQTLRIGRAKRLLDTTTLTITEIAFQAGFGSVRRFNATFSMPLRALTFLHPQAETMSRTKLHTNQYPGRPANVRR